MSNALMSLGTRAMAASYAALQTTGHNIANANVAGYSRQTVVLETAQGQFTGAGYFGRGVDVVNVVRAHDEFLTREAAAASSLAAADAARLTHLTRLEELFPTGESGLGAVAGAMLNSMLDLANRPADSSTRQVVLARAGDFASRVSAIGAGLDQAQQGVTADLRSAVTDVNSLTQAIAEANSQIAAANGLGRPANDLLDERDRLIAKLSQHLSVTRIDAEDGTATLFAAGGQCLVLGTTAKPLDLMPDPEDPARVAVALVEGSVRRALPTAALVGGDIAGLLRFQNDDLAAARNLVGQLAAAMAGALNAQQALGITLQPPLGTVAGSPLFSVGAPQALAHASNARDAFGVPLTAVTLTVIDPAALQASDYDLEPDTAVPGNYLLTRRSDGLVRSIASGTVVDGVQIDVGPPAPAAGDRFLLQPVARAANDFSLQLQDPRDLAAAAPLIGVRNAANTGTVAIGTLAVTAAPLPVPGGTASISFTDNAGGYDWSVVDAGNNVVLTGSGVWTAGARIPQPPVDINGFSVELTGVPRSGDQLSIAPTPASAVASNNGNALALLALRDSPIVGGLTPTDAYASAMTHIGVRVQGATSAADISTAVSAQAEQRRSATAGVNLDEEAARLIQFQQSYQAAAKMLQVAQSIFETLLSTAGAR
jgi:flagellar hook-associated protein 1 FlgK